jgi:hypothetical protein
MLICVAATSAIVAYLAVGAASTSGLLVLAVLWALWTVPTLGLGCVAVWRRTSLPWKWYLAVTLGGSLALLGLSMTPPVAHALRYGLPYGSLPPRIGYAGRDYEGDALCVGPQAVIGRPHDHIAQVSTLWTLFGPPRSIVTTSSGAVPGVTTTVIFVHDGGCYRPYELEGGP